MKLKNRGTVEIIPTSPFHFDATFFKPAHFTTNDRRWQPGKRWQTLLWRGKKLGTIFENTGTAKEPRVGVQIFSQGKLSPEFTESVKEEIIWRYNLNLDLNHFYNEAGEDPLLKPLLRKFRGLRPMHHGSLYEYLIIAIVLQNATVKRSVNMMQNLFEHYGAPLEFDDRKLWCFWPPAVLAQAQEQELREIKMGYRAKSLIKVSQAFAHGEINESRLRLAPREEQERALLSLYGIGPASVGYIMFDVFHRWDYLKHISPWEQKIYTQIFFNRDHEKKLVPVGKMLKYFERYGRWKNLAVHYVWENIWWERRNKRLPWLEKLIRL